tara:strand:- start:7 stop:243 length:237 start_codon:yes stop_codon:yes gene_type:complete
MGLFNYIKLKIFLISLALGLFAVYITMPDTRKIYVYPTPENIDILQYKDKTDTCFQFKEKEVKCPSNIEEITQIPIQS